MKTAAMKISLEPKLDCADTALVQQRAKALLSAANGDAQRAAEDARMLAAEASKEGDDDAVAFWLEVVTAVWVGPGPAFSGGPMVLDERGRIVRKQATNRAAVERFQAEG